MNIYTASAKDLQSLKGIGAKLEFDRHDCYGRFGYEHQYPCADMVRLGS